MRNHLYKVIIAVLVIILAIVSFYMLWVHVPYYNYHHQLDEIRNDICETNHYEYMDYFTEHRGKDVYYILRVNINGVLSYVAYDKDLTLVDTYQGDVANVDEVKSMIVEKYSDIVSLEDIDDLDIGYENNRFVYCTVVQKDDSLLYVYYDLSDGSFVKAYNITGGV